MSISIDAGKVEDLRKLTAFFEFISNPQAYKEFLAETKAVLENMDKTIILVSQRETMQDSNLHVG